MLASIVMLFNGAFLPSSPPARLLFGRVMAPLVPIVARIADIVTLTGNEVTVVRAGVTRTFPIVARDGTVFFPLAAVARAFGGSVAYDSRHGIVAIAMPPRTTVATPAPFDPSAPQVAPTQVFTPQPGPASPRAMDSGDPQPRRTAIPATPSRVPGG